MRPGMRCDQDLAQLNVPAAGGLLDDAAPARPSDLGPAALLGREIFVWYRFVRRDLPAVVIAGLLTASAALHAGGGASIVGWARVLASGVVFFGLYLYAFCLMNQISGVEEDAVNKPDRPIPSGLVTLEGAKVRRAIVMIAYPLVGHALGGLALLQLALLAQGLFIAHEQGGLHRHWLSKNLCAALGLLVLLAGAWTMVAPLTPAGWRWILFAATSFGITLPLQDLRDADGDRRAGRTTLVMTVGEPAARAALGLAIALQPVATHLVLIAPLHRGWKAAGCEAILTLVNLVTAARAVALRDERADHATYMLHSLWFSALLATAIVLL